MQCVLMLQQVVHMVTTGLITLNYTRWFKYDRDCLHLFTHKSVPVIFEPPCIIIKPSIILNFLLSLLIFLAICCGWNLP